jgi:uncharacterized protein YchJ
MINTTTPREISHDVLTLCRRLVDNPEPLFINVTPLPDAAKNDCFQIVSDYTSRHGGTVIYGWQIWEWPLVFIEAEFHAVWKDNDNVLHDFTPKQISASRILFLPDPRRIYQGKQVINVWHKLSTQQDVDDFIKAREAEFEFMSRGDRATQHGVIEVKLTEAEEHAQILKRKAVAYQHIADRLQRIERNDRCPCDSGKKYKNCHGK